MVSGSGKTRYALAFVSTSSGAFAMLFDAWNWKIQGLLGKQTGHNPKEREPVESSGRSPDFVRARIADRVTEGGAELPCRL